MAAAEPICKRTFFLAIALMAVAGYFYVAHGYYVPAHPGTDQNGYLVGGKMFAEHLSTGFTPDDPYAFVGRMWIGNDAGRYFPKYPIGLSILYAIALKVGGVKYGVAACFWVSPVCATLALLGCFLLMRLVVGSFFAVLGMLVVASSPVMLGLTDNPNSHASCLCVVVWGMYFLLRWWQTAGFWRAAVAGMLLGTAVTIRYTEGLLLLPLGLVLLMNLHWRDRRSLAQAAAAVGGWSLPVLLLACYNLHSFGHLTGYDPTNESTGFSLTFFYNNWETMTKQLHDTGLFFMLPFAVGGLVLMFAWNWRLATVLAAWVVPNVLLYTAYYWAPDGQWVGYLRFFLTIFPGLALFAVWFLSRAVEGILHAIHGNPHLGWTWRSLAVVTAGGLVAVGIGVGAYTAVPNLEADYFRGYMTNLTGQLVLQHAPKGSVIFADERLLNHLQLIGNYRLYSPEQFNRTIVQRLNISDPDAPQVFQPQRAKALYDRLKNASDNEINTELMDLVKKHIADGHRVFVITPARGWNVLRNRGAMPTRFFQSHVVAAWDEMTEPRRERVQGWVNFGRAPLPAVQRSTAFQILELSSILLPPPKPPAPPPAKPLKPAKPKPAAKPPVTRPTTLNAH